MLDTLLGCFVNCYVYVFFFRISNVEYHGELLKINVDLHLHLV